METIQLLDGNQYKKTELLERMNDDSFYYGELNRLALSSSSMKLLLDSPKKYKYVQQYGQPSTPAMDIGWLLHTAILEPHVFSAQKFVDVQSKNTKAYKEAKAQHDGRVFTIKDKNNAERLADAFLRNEHALSYLKNAEFEKPVIGNVMGFPVRGKADILGDGYIADIKTTSDIKAFPYSAQKYSYELQCFLYCNLFDVKPKDFKFLVIDKGSLDIGIADCSEDFYFKGEQKCERALDLYESFFIDGVDLDSYCMNWTL